MLSRNHVNTTCSRRREVTYSNHKELRSLNQLLHDAQLLSLEVHIQEHAGKALISLLRNLDTTLP
ncbi:predicted protein [Nematostella vectensis]|uniref:Uncharacterized protein n=2 Tax=Nematostella vectensis TaxID=45351 RepID=A7RJJ2_NEMVE|nr:predicted protein [Nematostella vectensis]|eukprot:XP_001640336.1 predicted protein [Nematostella vectensis]